MVSHFLYTYSVYTYIYIHTHFFFSWLVKSVQCFKHDPHWAIKEVMEIFSSLARKESCGNTMGNGSDAEMGEENKFIGD